MKHRIIGACLITLFGLSISTSFAEERVCISMKPLGANTLNADSLLTGASKESADVSEWQVQPVGNNYKKKKKKLTKRQRTGRLDAQLEMKSWQAIYKGLPVFVFHTSDFRWEFWNHTERLNSGVANGGKSWCRDTGRSCLTPVGEHVYYRKGPGAGCVSSKYPVNKSKPRSRMPFCMFFKGGYAIHGSKYIRDGKHGSHGCIRIKTPKARWLYKHMPVGTRVFVMPY